MPQHSNHRSPRRRKQKERRHSNCLMDIFPEIKGPLFKRQSACGAGPRELHTRCCLCCRHSNQVHPAPASRVLCCGDESRRMYRLVIKAFDHHIKPIKMLFISLNFLDFSRCHSRVWQADRSLSSNVCSLALGSF